MTDMIAVLRLNTPYRPVLRMCTPTLSHRSLSSSLQSRNKQIPPEIACQLDLKSPLANSSNLYKRHFAISTGHYNWPSSAKEDEHRGPLQYAKEWPALSRFVVDWTAALKPNKDILYTKSSHRSEFPCVHIYPDYVKIKFNSKIPKAEQVREFQSQWIDHETSRELHFMTVEELPKNSVHIYVCCHAARDERCGVIGGLLLSTLREYISSPPQDIADDLQHLDLQVFGSSHVGGHKYAGNMILYRPQWRQGVWYGRISPSNVDEIMRETVIGQKVLGKHWRGGLPGGNWDPKNGISAEDAERLSREWRDCACR